MREKHQKAFPLIFDKCITVIPSTKPMQERESGQRDDNMGRDTPSRILDDERRAFAAQSMEWWNDAALPKAAWDIPTKLLEVGVGIWFDTDGILNLDKDGELRLSIFSALAQDESAKKSEAVRFGQQEAIKRGTVFGFDNMFGFRKRDGKLEIDESEAPAIRKLFELYATDQYSMKQIEKILYNDGFRNHNGNKTVPRDDGTYHQKSELQRIFLLQ